MSPTFIGPVLTPMPIASCGQPRCAKATPSSRIAFCIPSAAATASCGWRGFGSGAPQNAMIASPMYLSIVPRLSWMTAVIGVRYAFISADSSRGGSRSDSVVKSRTSEKSTVSSRLSPSIEKRSPVSRICATRSRGTYSPNMSDSLRIARDSRRKPPARFHISSASSMSSVAASGTTDCAGTRSPC